MFEKTKINEKEARMAHFEKNIKPLFRKSGYISI